MNPSSEMKNPQMILAIDKYGNEITTNEVSTWLKQKEKKKLADFLFQRLYGRYIKPFDFEDSRYKKEYKNGFSIMANCCLLIETFVSFYESTFRETDRKSERCFGFFFLTFPEFNLFSTGGLAVKDYLNLKRNPLKNIGTPLDFYKNVRCGILHNGETRNGWTLTRNGPLFDPLTKKINATEFMKQLIKVLKRHKHDLLTEDINTSSIWVAYVDRITDILNKA